MICNFLATFGRKLPTAIPARLCLFLHQERSIMPPPMLIKQCRYFKIRLMKKNKQSKLATCKQLSKWFKSNDEFQEAIKYYRAELARRHRIRYFQHIKLPLTEAQGQELRDLREDATNHKIKFYTLCTNTDCANFPSFNCDSESCKKCCRGPCKYHRC